MRLMHTADLHLHPEYPERRKALETICQLAKEYDCSALLIAGDLFDRAEVALKERPKLRELFDRYPFEVFIVAGNHDERCYASQFDYGQRVHIAAQKGLERWSTKYGVEIWGLPFQRGTQAGTYLAQQTPQPQTPTVLLTHASFYHSDSHWLGICRQLQQHEQEESTGEFALLAQDLQGKGFSYVALGHWHNPTHPPLQMEQTLVAYAGSPCPVASDELGRRQAVLVELEAGKVNVRFITIQGVPYYRKERFFVVPGGEERLVKQLDDFLQQQADPLARAKLRLEGFLQWEESRFRAELERLRSQYEGAWDKLTIEHHWSNLSETPSGLVKMFIEQISATTQENFQPLLNEFEPEPLRKIAQEWIYQAHEELKQEALCLGLEAIHQQQQRSRR